MKFGDIVINTSAGQRNPNKVLMFLERGGQFVTCLSRKGKKIQFYKADAHILVKVNSLDMSAWDEIAADELKKEDE